MPYRVGQSQSSSKRQHFRKFTLASRFARQPYTRSPRELYCTTGEAYPEPLIYQCSWFSAFKPPSFGYLSFFQISNIPIPSENPGKFGLLRIVSLPYLTSATNWSLSLQSVFCHYCHYNYFKTHQSRHWKPP